MSFALAFIALVCVALIVAWFIGMLVPAYNRGRLALVAAILMLLPGLAFLLDAPIHLIGIKGEEGYGFVMLAIPTFLLGLVGAPLSLIAHARFHPFGIDE